MPRGVLESLLPHLQVVTLKADNTLFAAGDEVTHTWFPLGQTVIALIVPMQDGRAVEAATVGREGVVGGVISLGHKPAFCFARVQVAGEALRLPLKKLEAAKLQAPRLHDLLVRYADCLIAQVLQSAGCATLHGLEARTARWLLTIHDRLDSPNLPLTQEALAEMLGVARTYMSRIARSLQKKGAVTYSRGVIHMKRRDVLADVACECYEAVRRHFDRVLPGCYPRTDEGNGVMEPSRFPEL
jgi:CRP-like cAMP-binding protein